MAKILPFDGFPFEADGSPQRRSVHLKLNSRRSDQLFRSPKKNVLGLMGLFNFGSNIGYLTES